MTLGSVVLVPFPFDDLSATKVRPAVVLTEPVGPHPHVVLAFVTSRLPEPPLPTDLPLLDAAPDFEGTGLKVSSALRLHRVVTVAISFVSRRLGTLSERQQAEVDERLRRLFGL